jgi:uncharacterized protein YggU (UPF0235/DUF167 family)
MLLSVKVFPQSKKEEVAKRSNDSFEVRVKERPEKGLANRAAVKALAAYLNIPGSRIELVRGFKNKNKTFKLS